MQLPVLSDLSYSKTVNNYVNNNRSDSIGLVRTKGKIVGNERGRVGEREREWGIVGKKGGDLESGG